MTPLSLFHYPFSAMGSPCELQLYAADEVQFRAVTQQVVDDILRLEHKYSRYRSDSYLSEINRCAAQGRAIEVDYETAQLLNYATTCYQQSDGLFDITSGCLRRLWDFTKPNVAIPSQTAITNLMQFIGWDKVVWQNPRLSFPIAGLELDLGGIVKEFAADRAASICIAHGVKHGLINLGGDIKVIGAHPDASPWRIGIRDPRNKDAILHVVELSAGAMASSGDYERCIEVDGKRYGHIINPQTGWPTQYFASITVISNYCVLAGSAATIAMLKERDGIDWLNRLNLPYLGLNVHGKIIGNLW